MHKFGGILAEFRWNFRLFVRLWVPPFVGPSVRLAINFGGISVKILAVKLGGILAAKFGGVSS